MIQALGILATGILMHLTLLHNYKRSSRLRINNTSIKVKTKFSYFSLLALIFVVSIFLYQFKFLEQINKYSLSKENMDITNSYIVLLLIFIMFVFSKKNKKMDLLQPVLLIILLICSICVLKDFLNPQTVVTVESEYLVCARAIIYLSFIPVLWISFTNYSNFWLSINTILNSLLSVLFLNFSCELLYILPKVFFSNMFHIILLFLYIYMPVFIGLLNIGSCFNLSREKDIKLLYNKSC